MTAKALGIPLWELDQVPIMYQRLAMASVIAEGNAEREFRAEELKFLRGKR